MSHIGRRGFLKAIASASAAAAVLELDPEKLLWVPGQKTIVDLGAGKTMKPATVQEIAKVTLTPQEQQFAEMLRNGPIVPRGWLDAHAPLQEIYSPSRYRLTTGGNTLVLDSRGRPTGGYAGRSRRPMVKEEVQMMFEHELQRSDKPFIPRNRLDVYGDKENK